MAASSSNPSFIVEVGEEYPYPSHISTPNLVTVKLSGKDKYKVWKTQMLCLLLSQNMLGFIDGKFLSPERNGHGKGKVGDMESWIRSDALAKSWILGSLSEQVATDIVDRLTDPFTAKDAWDELLRIYGPPDSSKANRKTKEEKIEGLAEHFPSVYMYTLLEEWGMIKFFLKNNNLQTKITSNGDTVLHVAVSSSKNHEFLEKLLELAREKIRLEDLRKLDGSTLLHVAAMVGNTVAANILVARNPDLLLTKDNNHQTPLAIALSNTHSDTAQCLYDHTEHIDQVQHETLFSGPSGDELLVLAISSKNFGLGCNLINQYTTLDGEVVLMAIAQNMPCDLNFWERRAEFMYIADKSERGMNWRRRPTLNTNGFLWIRMLNRFAIKICVWPFVKERVKLHVDAMYLLNDVCYRIFQAVDSRSWKQYYTNPIFEATRQNEIKVVEKLLHYFLSAIWSVNEDGHNIIQYAVINRSEKIYNLLYQMNEQKNIYKTINDYYGNNLLHLAARLAPTERLNLISGAALQVQHELQWFKEVERFVCPLNIMQKNSSLETPQMVFTREHKELVVEGEKWMKTTAESYTITAALITTIVFAAAITVPGGNNQDTGEPIFTNNPAFTIFAISDAISLFTAVTSLLMFLSILSSRFAEQDFLFKLPRKLIIGLATLFISTTAMIIAFGATLFIVFGQKNALILIPIGALTCLPITSCVTFQFPLVADFTSATYGRSIFGKKVITTSTTSLYI